MIKPLKLQHTQEQKILFFSDLHWNHNQKFIYEKRGFNSIEEHNKTLIERWNNKVSSNDIIFHLGDLIFKDPDGDRLIYDLLPQLNFGILYIMPGNHTSGYKVLWNQNNNRRIDDHGCVVCYHSSVLRDIVFISNYFEVIVNGKSIVLSHYPILSWNGMAKDSWLFFGHCHHTLKDVDWVRDNFLTGKCLDVGVESIKEPIDFDEVKGYMNNRVVIQPDHHNQNTKNPF